MDNGTGSVSGDGSTNSDRTQVQPVIGITAYQGSVVREGPVNLELSLPFIKEANLELAPPLKVYQRFLPLRRNNSNAQVEVQFLCNARDSCVLTDTQIGNGVSNQQVLELACFWNWGGVCAGYTQLSVARYFKSERETTLNLVLDHSLVESLRSALTFSERFRPGLPAAEKTELFKQLHKKADQFINAIILRLDEKKRFESGRPISHVVADIIACIAFLKDQAGVNDSKINSSQEYKKIEHLRRCFWLKKLGMDKSNPQLWSDSEPTVYKEYLNREVNSIFREVRNLLLLDPDNCLCPAFGPSRGDKQLHHPLLRHILPSTFRGDVFSAAGVKPGEIKSVKDVQEHLSDIDASYIHNGPFRLKLTDDPSRHLRFDKSIEQPTILVLDTDTIMRVALLDLTGLMEYVGLPTFLTELMASHRLLFASPASQSIASSLRAIDPARQRILRIDPTILDDYRQNWPSDDISLQLSDFPIYGARLQHIRKRMEDWRPLRLRQAWRRPYKDPLPYYAFWFGVFIGITAILSVGFSIAQFIAQLKSHN